MERTITASNVKLGINSIVTEELQALLEYYGCDTDYEIKEFTWCGCSCFTGRFIYTYIGHISDKYPKFFERIKTDTERFSQHLEMVDNLAYRYYLYQYATLLQNSPPPENPFAREDHIAKIASAAENITEQDILRMKYE